MSDDDRPSPIIPVAIFAILTIIVSIGLIVVFASTDDTPQKTTVTKAPKSKPTARTETDPDVVAGAGLLGFSVFVCVIAALVPTVGLLAALVALSWVARDAKARNMDGSALWMAIVFLTFPMGLLVYMMARPQGTVAPCGRCGNGRLLTSLACPHCGDKS